LKSDFKVVRKHEATESDKPSRPAIFLSDFDITKLEGLEPLAAFEDIQFGDTVAGEPILRQQAIIQERASEERASIKEAESQELAVATDQVLSRPLRDA
jgi:hypothetical protein